MLTTRSQEYHEKLQNDNNNIGKIFLVRLKFAPNDFHRTFDSKSAGKTQLLIAIISQDICKIYKTLANIVVLNLPPFSFILDITATIERN